MLSARPRFLANGEMGAFYIFDFLQAAILARFARFVQTYIGIRAVRVVNHTVVYASVQL